MNSSYITTLGIILAIVSIVLGLIPLIEPHIKATSRRSKITILVTAAILLIVAIFLIAAPLSMIQFIASTKESFSSASNTPNPLNAFTPTTTHTQTQAITPTPTDIPIPTPSATPTPTPFTYVADWSHGPNGWAVNDVWRVYGGALHSSGTGEIPFPFQLNPSPSGTTDYTAEWKSTDIDNSGGFGVSVRAGNDGSTYGYHISFNDQDINQDVWVGIFDNPGYLNGDHRKLFTVGPGEHDFIVSVKANLITIKVDGSQVMQVQDNTYPIGGSSSFFAGGQVNITYLKVTQQ